MKTSTPILISALVGVLATAGAFANTERVIFIADKEYQFPYVVAGRSVAELRTGVAEVSAYSSDVSQTDSDPFTMASGKRVYDGAVACPRNVKLGTQVEILGKTYVCEDRMNIRYTNNYDIWMETRGEALAFGRKQLEVKLVR